TRFYEHIRGDHDIEYDGGGLVVRQLEEALQAHLLEGTQGFSILNGPSHDVLFAVDPVRHLIGAQATNKVELRTKDRSAKFVITPGNIAVKCVTHTVEADSQVELKVGEDLEIVMSTGTIQLRAGGSQIILGP